MTSHGDKSLYETFDVLGKWWHPSRPRDVVAGVLHVDCSSMITLSLGSVFRPPRRSKRVPRPFPENEHYEPLFGLSEHNEEITLVHVQWAKVGIASTFRCQIAIFGAHVRNFESVSLDNYSFGLFDLSKWSNTPTPQDTMRDGKWSISLDIERRVSIPLPHRRMLIELADLPYLNQTGHSKLLGYRPRIFVKPDTPQKWNTARKTMLTIQRFLMMCAMRPMQVSHIAASVQLPKEKRPPAIVRRFGDHPVSIQIYADQHMKRNEVKAGFPVPFSLQQLSINAAALLDRWFSVEHRIKPMADVFFGELLRPSSYQETHFFHCSQSLEALHRRAYERKHGRFQTKKAFAQTIKRVESSLPKRMAPLLRKALVDAARNANLLSFLDRLNDLFRRLDPVLQARLVDDPRAFASAVRDTRNLFTHLERHRKSKAFAMEDWSEASDVMRSLLFIHLLKLCGMSDERLADGTNGVGLGIRPFTMKKSVISAPSQPVP